MSRVGSKAMAVAAPSSSISSSMVSAPVRIRAPPPAPASVSFISLAPITDQSLDDEDDEARRSVAVPLDRQGTEVGTNLIRFETPALTSRPPPAPVTRQVTSAVSASQCMKQELQVVSQADTTPVDDPTNSVLSRLARERRHG